MANIDTINHCEVCMDPTTDTGKNKKICCPYCNCVSCLDCFKEYLLQTPNLDCMKCKKMLDLEFLSTETPNSFYNKTYREYKTTLEISKEKSLLPSTQEIVEKILDNKRIDKEIKKLLDERREINEKIKFLRSKKQQINSKKDSGKSRQFIKNCPEENCRGFLTEDFICGICSTKVCERCHEIIQNDNEDNGEEVKDGDENENHVCNEEIVQNIKEINRHTKSCPECGIRIYKIDGCDQMWCVECKTAFSWKSGIIEKGRIHNPHYYEWQRQNNNGVAPRVPGDIPGGQICNEIPDIFYVLDIASYLSQNQQRMVRNAHRMIVHYCCPNNGIEAQHAQNIREYEIKKEKLRIQFLLKEIDEEKWLTELKRNLKVIEREKCVYDLLIMIREALKNIFTSFIQDPINNPIEIQLNTLRLYCNTQITTLDKRFKQILYTIAPSWIIPRFGNLFI